MSVAPHLTELDHRKRLAIQQEDYDSAKIIKQEIERIRAATFQQLPGAPRSAPALAPAQAMVPPNLFEEVKGPAMQTTPNPRAFDPSPQENEGGPSPFLY